jgi:hypothetical protein
MICMSLGSARAAGTSGISASFASNWTPERRDDPNRTLQLALKFPHPSWCGNTHCRLYTVEGVALVGASVAG